MQKLFNIKSKLIEKTQLNEFSYELKYEIPADFEYLPGQFVVLLVTPPFRRSYSVVEFKDRVMTLLIDVKPMGPASKYFIDTKIGDETIVMGPYGRFFMQDTLLNKVFISTSSGIAPFMPMIDKLATDEKFKDVKVDFFYGARHFEHDIAFRYFEKYINSNFQYFRCITQPEDNSIEFKRGRVTEVIPQMEYDFQNTEFYICGSPLMVEHMREILKEKGAEKVFFEKY